MKKQSSACGFLGTGERWPIMLLANKNYLLNNIDVSSSLMNGSNISTFFRKARVLVKKKETLFSFGGAILRRFSLSVFVGDMLGFIDKLRTFASRNATTKVSR